MVFANVFADFLSVFVLIHFLNIRSGNRRFGDFRTAFGGDNDLSTVARRNISTNLRLGGEFAAVVCWLVLCLELA